MSAAATQAAADSRVHGAAAVHRLLPLLVLLVLPLAAACEGNGPVEKAEVAAVVGRLEKSASARARAEVRLSQSSPYVTWGALAALIERTSASPDARAAAIRAVAATQRDLGLPGAVVQATQDANAIVRAEAIHAVVSRADPDSARALGEFLRDSPDVAVRADLEKALSDLKSRERDWYRARLTAAKEAPDRAMAARWLSQIGTEEDVPALISAAARFPNERLLQQEVLLALSKIGGEQAKFFVREQLRSRDPFLRGVSAFAESRLRDPEAVDILAQLLVEESVGDTRVSAAMALGLIGTEPAKAALAKGCKLGSPDKRVDLACSEAQRSVARAP